MIPGNSGLRAVCRKCGKSAPVNEFTLDPVYGLMVCQSCVKERKNNEKGGVFNRVKEEKEKQKQEESMKNRPVGWDADDAYLEMVYKQKESKKAIVEKIDEEKVRYSCFKCNFRFVYNLVSKTPKNCPYCGAGVVGSFKFK
jgi:hypothetical protein